MGPVTLTWCDGYFEYCSAGNLVIFFYVRRCLLRIDQTSVSETYMPTPSPHTIN